MERGTRRRILCIDDDAPLCRAIGRLLSGRYEVVGAPCYESAVPLLEREAASFSLILLDLNLGDGHVPGEVALADIRERWPDLEVVVLTVVTDLERVKTCLRAGVFDYLEKLGLQERLPDLVDRAVEVVEVRRARVVHEHEVERLRQRERSLSTSAAGAAPSAESAPVTPSRLAEMERRMVAEALDLASGNISQAARRLGITKDACWRKVHKLGLASPPS